MNNARWNGTNLVIDFDGVIADTALAQIIRTGNIGRVFVEDITWWHHPVFRDLQVADPDLFKLTIPIHRAAATLRGMHDSGYRITIATDRPLEAREYIVNWCAAWRIPFDHLILTPDKRVAGGHLLIDDKPSNVVDYADRVGLGILFGQPWNRRALPVTKYRTSRSIGWEAAWEQVRTWKYTTGRLPYGEIK